MTRFYIFLNYRNKSNITHQDNCLLAVENGRVPEIDSQEDILAKAGRSAELLRLQAAGYR